MSLNSKGNLDQQLRTWKSALHQGTRIPPHTLSDARFLDQRGCGRSEISGNLTRTKGKSIERSISRNASIALRHTLIFQSEARRNDPEHLLEVDTLCLRERFYLCIFLQIGIRFVLHVMIECHDNLIWII